MGFCVSEPDPCAQFEQHDRCDNPGDSIRMKFVKFDKIGFGQQAKVWIDQNLHQPDDSSHKAASKEMKHNYLSHAGLTKLFLKTSEAFLIVFQRASGIFCADLAIIESRGFFIKKSSCFLMKLQYRPSIPSDQSPFG